MPRPLNRYSNAKAIYGNPNWKYYAPGYAVAVLFNSKKMPFFIKNGKRQTFNKRANSNGQNRLFYGSGNDNYLVNTPSNAKNVFAHYNKFKTYGLTKRNPLHNTVSAYKIRAAQMRVQAKKNAAQAKRVNKLVRNVKAGRSLVKANTNNLLALVMRYQHPNAGAYYTRNNKGRITNNNGKKPVRKQLLANIANFKKYNFFA